MTKGRPLLLATVGVAFVSYVQCKSRDEHPVGNLMAPIPVDDGGAVDGGAPFDVAAATRDDGTAPIVVTDASATACDAVQQHFRLNEKEHGVNGVLSLLGCPKDDTPPWMKSQPEQLAILRVVSDSGRELDRRLLQSSSAILERAVLRPDGRATFLVTEDLTAGFGTHSGPVTTLYDVTNARLEAVTDASGDVLAFPQTMYATWHRVPHGKGQDILGLSITTDLLPDGGVSHESRLARWTFVDGLWRATIKKEPGEVEIVDGADMSHYPPPSSSR